ncbi:MAG: MIP family channel protein [Clostridia bacterium]|nr:MIP family channel protein [Clostridia bacterium]
MKKYLAEFLGTFVLVFFSCGAAALSGGIDGVLGVLGIALAFGLSIVAMAYAIGHVSGCHINPAVSLAMLIDGRLGIADFVGYLTAQFAGGIAAAALLKAVVAMSDLDPVKTGLGADGYGALSYVGLGMWGAILVEIVLTCVFVLTILGVTTSEKTGSLAGIVIGLTLTFVHILGIPLTGTSVNPARSFGPALFTGGEAWSQVWVFLAAPMAGAIVAALLWRLFKPAKAV